MKDKNKVLYKNISRYDPNGSYTGTPYFDDDDVPVQDADDL